MAGDSLSDRDLGKLREWKDDLAARLRLIAKTLKRPDGLAESDYQFCDDSQVEEWDIDRLINWLCAYGTRHLSLEVQTIQHWSQVPPECRENDRLAWRNLRRLCFIVADTQDWLMSLPRHDLIIEAYAIVALIHDGLSHLLPSRDTPLPTSAAITETVRALPPECVTHLHLVAEKIWAQFDWRNWGSDDASLARRREKRNNISIEQRTEQVRNVLDDTRSDLNRDSIQAELRKRHGSGMRNGTLTDVLAILRKSGEYTG